MPRTLLAALLICAGLSASDCLGTDLRLAPPAGSYAVAVPVVPLVRLATGERLVYTVDGSAPTAAAWPLSQPILLTDTTTVRVATVSAQGVVTRQVAGTYTINGLLTTARPVASPAAGAYPAPQRVTLTSATSGATIRYTLDGGEPTTSSPIYSAAVPIATTTTLRARAFGGRLSIRLGRLILSVPAAFPSGVMTATYVITGQQQQVATPVIAPASGLYRAELNATATTATADAELRYRLDGTDPGPTDALLPVCGLVVDRSLAVRIRAFRTGWTPSAVVAATYTLQVPEPVITPASGLANAPLTADITIPTGATVRFTTDGTDPTASAAVVSGPIAVEHSLQLRAQAERAGWSPSAIVATAYSLQPLAPTASLPTGSYVGDQSVTLASTTANAAIHYTVDGTVPTTASPQATGPIALQGSCTLHAVVTRTGWTDSPILSLTYDLRVPDVTLTPAGATFTAPVIVQATVPAGAAAVYTVDGSEPTAASASWPVAGVSIDTATTLTVRAMRSGWTSSAVATDTYAFQATAPTVDLPAGSYVGVQTANLATVTPGATIRYTVDGSDPLTATTAETFTGPIAITRSLTLRAATIRSGWITSPALEAVYTLDLPPVITSGPTVTPSPVSGTIASVAVVATDDGDPTLLQTAWSATGPAATTFASTGPVSATATFTAAGTYTIQVVVRDQAGQSATASSAVTVAATPTTLVLSPTAVTVPAGGTATFTTALRDQFGQSITTASSMTWSVTPSSAGGIADGVLTVAGDASGSLQVTATCDILSAVAQVTVGAPPPPPTFTQRRSPLYRLPVERFDAARWASDAGYRTAYLAASVPERVWETLSPTAGAPKLTVIGSAKRNGRTGDIVSVAVSTEPNMPVSFCVERPDIASMGSTTAWTVISDLTGSAVVSLSINGAGETRVIAGSPTAVGTIHITLVGK